MRSDQLRVEAPPGTFANVQAADASGAVTRRAFAPASSSSLGAVAERQRYVPGGSRVRESGAAAAAKAKVDARDPVDLSQIPTLWERFTKALLDQAKKKPSDDGCVICPNPLVSPSDQQVWAVVLD